MDIIPASISAVLRKNIAKSLLKSNPQYKEGNAPFFAVLSPRDSNSQIYD